jgi:hypothetical protein
MKKVLGGLAGVLADIAICASVPAYSDDGYHLWLRYGPTFAHQEQV